MIHVSINPNSTGMLFTIALYLDTFLLLYRQQNISLCVPYYVVCIYQVIYERLHSWQKQNITLLQKSYTLP